MKYIITTTKTYIDYIDTKLTSVLAIVMLIISHIYILPYICILLIIKYNTIYIYDIVISSILYSMLYLCFSLAIIIYIYILDIILLHIFKVTTQIFAMSKLINSINFILNNFDIAISILLDKILNIYISSVITLLIIITVNYASTIINYMHFTHNKYSKLLNQKFNNDYYTYKYTKNIFYTEIIKEKMMISTLFVNLWCVCRNIAIISINNANISSIVNMMVNVLAIQILTIVVSKHIFNIKNNMYFNSY